MGRAKDIVVKVLPASAANAFVKKHHYSGKVVNNSSLHFGAFLDGILHGVMSFGSPLDKRKVLPLVHTADGVPCLWNEMLELNRMAFDEHLPRNSESRCIAVAFRLIRANAPHIRWVLSFSDGTQCGDGTIYRASGFALTAVRESVGDLWELPESLRHLSAGAGLSGGVVHRVTIQCKTSLCSHWVLSKYKTHNVSMALLQRENGGRLLSGYQLRYIYLLDKTCRLNCPDLPFSEIDRMGAGMYKGEKITLAERITGV